MLMMVILGFFRDFSLLELEHLRDLCTEKTHSLIASLLLSWVNTATRVASQGDWVTEAEIHLWAVEEVGQTIIL